MKKLLKFLILMQLFFWQWPRLAMGLTWEDFSQSLNKSFSGEEAFSLSNALGFIVLLLILLMLVLVTRRHLAKKEQIQRETYDLIQQKLRSQVTLLPSGKPQQRQWFRIQSTADINWILAEQADKVIESQYNKDHLIDISGGGLCFSTFKELNRGDEIRIVLPNEEDLFGRVVRIDKEQDIEPGLTHYQVSIQFIDLTNGKRDKIVAWVMNHERSAIQKEKQEEAEKELLSASSLHYKQEEISEPYSETIELNS